MVYLLATPDTFVKYKSGYRSRIIYIGTTGKGAHRPAASAVNKASQAFGSMRGVKTIEVHIATCGGRKALRTWKLLEASLINTFRNRYFELPHYNKVRPKHTDGIFSSKRLEKLILAFEK